MAKVLSDEEALGTCSWLQYFEYLLRTATMPFVFISFGIRRGLIGASKKKNKLRMAEEDRPSISAEGLAMARAVLYDNHQGDDRVSKHLLDWDARAISNWVASCRAVRHGSAPVPVNWTSMKWRLGEIDAAIAGVKPFQMVILGAGLDTRAYRFQDQVQPGATFFEIDTPPTQRLKMKMVTRAAKRSPKGVFTFALKEKRVKYVPCDFSTQSFMDVLTSSEKGFDAKNSNTVVLCEGVLMYLALEDVEKTMRAVSSGCAKGTTMIVHIIDREYVDHHAFSKGLKAVGEPMRWGLGMNETPESFFGPLGFRVTYVSPLPDNRVDPKTNERMGGTEIIVVMQVV